MSTLWSPQQREWLQALGHQVWTLAAAEPEAMVAEPEPARTGVSAMRDAAAALQREERPRPAPARATAPADRLLQAVLRAAGRAPGDAVVAALLPDPAALRGSAAAKRALWPRLRALRRPGGDE